MQKSEVEKAIREQVNARVREWALSLASRLDVLCNPEHPEIAREQLKLASSELLKILRDTLI
jgi:hypothetical protein